MRDDSSSSAREQTWRRYLRFWGTRVTADVDDELRFHIDMLVDRYRADGMSDVDARAAAAARLGDMARHTNVCVGIATRRERRVTRALTLDALAWDLRYAVRTLLLHRTWTAVAVVTLALGIGANTAVFSVVNSLILHQLHYRDANRVMIAWRRQEGSAWSMYPEKAVVAAWRNVPSIEAPQSYTTTTANLTIDGDSIELQAAKIGAGFMAFTGLHPIVGRSFDTTETVVGGPPVVMLAERMWRERFAASREVIGRRITLSGKRFTVVGVAPATLELPAIAQPRTAVWLPLIEDNESLSPPVLLRLARDVDPHLVERELDSVAVRIRPAAFDGPRFHYALERPRDSIGVGQAIYLLAAAVALLLLIACANVAHLMLARGAARERELAIRTALGATGLRLARQLITETVLLAGIGGLLGVAVAVAGIRWLASARPRNLGQLDRTHIDSTVLLVALVMTATAGIAFGLVATARASRGRSRDIVRSMASVGASTRRQAGVRALLVISEMAVSSLLLVAAVLVVRSAIKLQQVDTGFNAHQLYTIDVRLPRAAYPTKESVRGVMDRLAERARQLPTVSAVTIASAMPPDLGLIVAPLETETRTGPRVNDGSSFIPTMLVDSSFFRALGVRLLDGATFGEHADDRNDVIIDQSLARRLWPGERAVGRRFRFVSPDAKDPNPWNTVVGVANDIVEHSLTTVGKEGLVYYPNAGGAKSLVVRTTDPAGVLREIQSTAARIDASITKLAITSVEDEVSRTIARQRFSTMLLSGFALLAVILAAVGLYGVLSYAVGERTREIGVRIALGATPAQIGTTVGRGGLVLSAVGLLLGLLASVWATGVLRSVLFGVDERDLASFAAASLLLLGVAAVACLVPMRRAMRVDPVIAMRDGGD